jgi:hypothetical protein
MNYVFFNIKINYLLHAVRVHAYLHADHLNLCDTSNKIIYLDGLLNQALASVTTWTHSNTISTENTTFNLRPAKPYMWRGKHWQNLACIQAK